MRWPGALAAGVRGVGFGRCDGPLHPASAITTQARSACTLHHRAERTRTGIAVDATTWEEVLQAGEKVGLPRSAALALI